MADILTPGTIEGLIAALVFIALLIWLYAMARLDRVPQRRAKSLRKRVAQECGTYAPWYTRVNEAKGEDGD